MLHRWHKNSWNWEAVWGSWIMGQFNIMKTFVEFAKAVIVVLITDVFLLFSPFACHYTSSLSCMSTPSSSISFSILFTSSFLAVRGSRGFSTFFFSLDSKVISFLFSRILDDKTEVFQVKLTLLQLNFWKASSIFQSGQLLLQIGPNQKICL